MKIYNVLDVEIVEDARLVQLSCDGDRDAFGQLVARYQSPVCALAYSACGNVSRSEDLAQESFITAWRQLRQLQEPPKFKEWLFGIARNLINNAFRQQTRNPLSAASELDDTCEISSPFANPDDQTISKEEETILWHVLAGMPEVYREPMVLFYREQESNARVAEILGLSEEVVRQRLSRGRAMLNERVNRFVETGLRRTGPTVVFTAGVLAAVSSMTISAKAATLGATAVKGSASAKAAGSMGLLGSILCPLLVIFGNYASYRMSLDEARTDEERRRVKTLFRQALGCSMGLSAVFAIGLWWACRSQPSSALFWGVLFAGVVVIYFLTLLVFVGATLPARRRYLATVLQNECGGKFPPAAYEYRSRWTLLGLPVVHVRIGDRFDVLRGPVKAWIAIGSSHAVGILFASGGLAVAPISFGGIAIGLVPMGAISFGALALGACCCGIWAYGGLAIGWQAFGGLAVAWYTATGGIAVGHTYAIGGIANQTNLNNSLSLLQHDPFLRWAGWASTSTHCRWMTLIWVLPLSVQAWIVSRARRQQEQASA